MFKYYPPQLTDPQKQFSIVYSKPERSVKGGFHLFVAAKDENPQELAQFASLLLAYMFVEDDFEPQLPPLQFVGEQKYKVTFDTSGGTIETLIGVEIMENPDLLLSSRMENHGYNHPYHVRIFFKPSYNKASSLPAKLELYLLQLSNAMI